MPAITLSLDEKYIKYLQSRAEEEKRTMSSIVEIALDKEMKK